MSKLKAKFILKPVHKALLLNTPAALIDGVLGIHKTWMIRLTVMLIALICLVFALASQPPTISKSSSRAEEFTVVMCFTLIGGIWVALGEMARLPGGIQYNLQQLREARDRLHFGILLDGEIMDVAGGKRGDGLITIYYEFYNPEQKRLVGSSFAYRLDLEGRVPLIGTPIHVLYINDYAHEVL